MCGRRCNFASDDFFFPALFSIATRLTWSAKLFVSMRRRDFFNATVYSTFRLCLAVAVVVYANVQPDCEDSDGVPAVLQVSATGFMTLHVLALACESLILFFAMRGSLSDSQPRRKITYVLLFRAVLYVVEVVWAAFCTYVVVDEDVAENIDCDSFRKAVLVFLVMVYSYWLLLALIALLFLGFLDPCGCCCVAGAIKNLKLYDGSINEDVRLFNNRFNCSLWMSRFRAMFCCYRRNGLNGSKKLAIADVTRALGVIFSDFDATFSDKISGMLLAYHYQRRLVQNQLDPSAELKKVPYFHE